MDLQARYRRSLIGLGWSLLHPVATLVVLCAVFHRIFHVEIREYIPFLMAGLAWWGYTTGVVIQGCQCFIKAEAYIRQHTIPMAVYPLRSTLGAMIDFLIVLVLVFCLSWYFRGAVQFENPLALASLGLSLGLLFLFGWSVAVLMGYVNVVFRDIQHVCAIGFQILFYLTPVIYPPRVLAGTGMAWLLRYNPLAHFLKLIREPLEGRMPSPASYGVAVTVTLVLAVAAVTLLGHLQRRVILYL
jgi:ABC-type polysaccharide/polyol phosphate export permease